MDVDNHRNELRQKLIESAAKVVYTYTAHWEMVDYLEKKNRYIKIAQIVFTGIASCGLLSTVFNNCSCLPIIGGFSAFLSLSINLYSLNFNLPDKIKQHTDAANDLWVIRESYISLITDFCTLSSEEIRNKRDKLTERVNYVNKHYPGTDAKSYEEARKSLQQQEEQTFNEGEAEKILNLKMNSCSHKKDN